MKYLYTILLFLLALQLAAQTCPTEAITFVRQSQVDSFAILYPDCVDVDVDITFGASEDITSLSGLSNVLNCKKIAVGSSSNLKDFTGLENLLHVDVINILSDQLESLDGLEGLRSCGVLSALNALSLSSVAAVTDLESIDVLFLKFCPSLVEISGFEEIDSIDLFLLEFGAATTLDVFENLEYVKIEVSISGMTKLTSLSGFNSLKYAGEVNIISNFLLQELSGFTALEGSNAISIYNNDSLQTITGFDALERVSGKLQITENTMLETIDGFSVLDSVGTLELGNMDIDTHSINEVSAFQNLTVVEQDMDLRRLNVLNLDFLQSLASVGQPQNDSITNILRIDSLAHVTDLSGMESIMSVQDHILLIGNDNLTSLAGFALLDTAEVSNLGVIVNPLLTDCANTFVCDYLKTGKPVSFANNGSGCSSLQDVQTACDILSNAANTATTELKVYPNPATDYLAVAIDGKVAPTDLVRLYNMKGQLQQVTQASDGLLDVSQLPRGAYQLLLLGEQNTTVRFVKQ